MTLRDVTATGELSAGKTPIEAMRCLKRRPSDQVYKQEIHDVVAAGDGSGAHMGASLQSGAAGSNPDS
jgi:transposase